MKWFVIAGVVVAACAALAGLVALIGASLPREHSASREARFDVPLESVWSAITDVDAFPSWRADVRRVERLPDRDGRKIWVEEGSSGRLTLAIDRMEPSRLLVLRIADPELPFGGTWTYELRTAEHGGTFLKITENGEIYNPFFRFMARFVFGYEATMTAYLESLEKRFAGVG